MSDILCASTKSLSSPEEVKMQSSSIKSYMLPVQYYSLVVASTARVFFLDKMCQSSRGIVVSSASVNAIMPFRARRAERSAVSLPGHSQRCYATKEYLKPHLQGPWLRVCSCVLVGCEDSAAEPCLGRGRGPR